MFASRLFQDRAGMEVGGGDGCGGRRGGGGEEGLRRNGMESGVEVLRREHVRMG